MPKIEKCPVALQRLPQNTLQKESTYFRTISMGCHYVFVLWEFSDSVNLEKDTKK